MNRAAIDFEVFPRIVRTGVPTAVTIRPRGAQAAFAMLLPPRPALEARLAARAAAVPAASPETAHGGMALVTSHAVVSAERQRPATSRLSVCTPQRDRNGRA